MNASQRLELWRFARGDADIPAFEQWLYAQQGLEGALGEVLYMSLISCQFSDKDAVWQARNALRELLTLDETCECRSIRDLASIPMGGEELADGRFYFEKLFDSLNEIASYGPDKWWLSIYRCNQCDQNWMAAQEERIYDEFLFQRISASQAQQVLQGEWPDTFWTYEKTLAAARKFSEAPQFFDPMAYSLQFTVDDLLKDRPGITESEIANLLGLSARHCARLVKRVRQSGTDKPQ